MQRRSPRRPPNAAPVTSGETLELTTHGMAVGGDALARDDGGRIVFVEGALPNETVHVQLHTEKADFAKGLVTAIVSASPDRVAPRCPHVAQGCGGCGWQHVDHGAQASLKRLIVIDALRRTGRIADAEHRVRVAAPLRPGAHRTTVRVAVDAGRAAYRAASSHRAVQVASCDVAHPVLEHILVQGRFGSLREVTVRVGVASGDLVVIGDPDVRNVQIPPLPDDWRALRGQTAVIGVRDSAAFHETVDGVRFRVSASSFFQTRPDGAAALVAEVDAALSDFDRDVLVDLYGGVGLFAATIGRDFATVVTVEQHVSASDDAVVNLSGLPDAHVVQADVEQWRVEHDTLDGRSIVVVADPSRSGLGRGGVATIASLQPEVVVLVSCDAGALGRDVRLLKEAGFFLDHASLVDLFPDTPHVEVVSRFLRR